MRLVIGLVLIALIVGIRSASRPEKPRTWPLLAASIVISVGYYLSLNLV
jgi:hypothetical protein